MGNKINKEITVSVVIVNYNNFELLDNCISSLYKYNNGEKLEVIVIDNNSTEENIEQFEQRYPIKLIMNSKNQGFAKANNIGLKYASGKYVLFLNNDVEFIENSIDKIIDFTELKSEPLFIGCQLLNVDNTLQESVSDFPTLANILGENFYLHKLLPRSNTLNKYHKNLFKEDSPIEVDVIKGAFMFCERKALEQLNGFDTKFFFYSEEVDLCYRFKNINGKIYFYPGTSIIHYENRNKNKNRWFYYKNLSIGKIQYYQKHFKGFKFLVSIILHYLGIFIRIPIYLLCGIIGMNDDMIKKTFYYVRLLVIYPKNVF